MIEATIPIWMVAAEDAVVRCEVEAGEAEEDRADRMTHVTIPVVRYQIM